MRLFLLLLSLSAWVSAALAAPSPRVKAHGPSPSPTRRAAPATPTPNNQAQTYGEIPASLAGVWLAVLNTPMENHFVSNWHIYRFASADGKWTLQRADRRSSPIDEKFLQSSAKKSAFEPTAEQVESMKPYAAAAGFPPQSAAFRAVVLRTADQFPREDPLPAGAAGALFSVEVLDQTDGVSVSGVSFYVRSITANEIVGETHAVTLTAAGFAVVPIELDGRFHMYRLQ